MTRAVPDAVYDPQRLMAVRATSLAGTPAEDAFDRLAGLASTLLEAPLAFVTLVDDQRSWYKSCVGAPPDARPWGPVEESFCQYVVGSGEQLVVGDARRDPRTRDNPAVQTMGVAAWAGFPIRAAGDEVLGTFCVVDTVPREWTERDLQVLQTLAASASAEIALRAALIDEHAQRELAEATTRELAVANRALVESSERLARLAHTLQRSLLPPLLPAVPGLEVAARYRPAAGGQEVTGDFYDVFQTVRGAWSIVMGDVCGKGPDAATVTSLARHTIRAAALRTTVPSRVLRTLNEALLRRDVDDERFVTVACATVRTSAAGVRMALSLAGHPLPLLRRADGAVTAIGSAAMPLGLFPDPQPRTVQVDLSPGDAAVFYTDGLIEARRGDEQFDMARLQAAVAELAGDAESLVSGLVSAVDAFRTGAPADDTAVLVVRVPDR